MRGRGGGGKISTFNFFSYHMLCGFNEDPKLMFNLVDNTNLTILINPL